MMAMCQGLTEGGNLPSDKQRLQRLKYHRDWQNTPNEHQTICAQTHLLDSDLSQLLLELNVGRIS